MVITSDTIAHSCGKPSTRSNRLWASRRPQYFAQTYVQIQIQNKAHVQKKKGIWIYKRTCLKSSRRQLQQWDRVMSAKQIKWKRHEQNTTIHGFYADIRYSEIESKFGLQRGRIKWNLRGLHQLQWVRIGAFAIFNYTIQLWPWNMETFLTDYKSKPNWKDFFNIWSFKTRTKRTRSKRWDPPLRQFLSCR